MYRSENGKLFLVFKTTDRGDRVDYLRNDLLYDVFEDLENEIPDFDEHTADRDDDHFLPRMLMSRTHSCTLSLINIDV